MLGVSAPLAGGSLLASYQSADADSQRYATATGNANFDPDYTVWGVAFTYPLSKRTNVYLGYGQVSAKGSLSSTQVDRQQSALGLRHRF
jgi:predicted porin